MAGRNQKTISEYCGEQNGERGDKCLNKKQISKNYINNKSTKSTFTVQNYQDYNVYSDVENVLNLNPVSYINHVQDLQHEENKKSSDTKDDRKSRRKSLINNIDNGGDKPSSISTFLKTAAHIIAPATTLKQSVVSRRIPRIDNSEQNYYDNLALNEQTIGLFGGHKTRKSSSVNNHRFIQFSYLFCLDAELVMISNHYFIFISSHNNKFQ